MRTLFSGARLFDGTGSAPAAADLVVDGTHIIDIGTGLDADAEVSVSGLTILPGMFDCHTHVMYSQIDTLDDMTSVATPFSYPFFQAAQHLRQTLAQGITTIRDAAGADLGVKQAVADGLIAGPRMLIAITMLSQTGGHGDHWMPCGGVLPRHPPHPGRPAGVVDGVDGMRRRVRELIRAGADVIKVATSGGVISPRDDPTQRQFSDAELAVLMDEAALAGRTVMAHAQGTEGIKAAIRAGVRSVEHGTILDDEAIEMMLLNGTWLVPTLSAPYGVLEAADQGVAVSDAVVRRTKEIMEIHQSSFQNALTAGVPIAMGTDSGVGRHGRNLRELELMAQAGMRPVDALVSATSAAARMVGLDAELGTLEPGKWADLVIVNGDPYDLATLGERIVRVYRGGVVAHRNDADDR